MDASNNKKIVGYFIEEAQEHLETLEKGILELSSAVNDEETINELFRAAHSVKGGAAMLGFTSIQKSSHRLEDAFKIIRDHKPIPVDQRLEGLFLKCYDTLQDLIERLQGPFGLPEEEGNQIMEKAEPNFKSLLDYLEQLSGDKLSSDDDLPVMASAKEFAGDDLLMAIKQYLREMLAIFKQPSTPENREDLQGICESLAKFAREENGWQNLLLASKNAIANPAHSYQLLAPVIIKEIKLAGDCLAVGKGSEVTPSQGLESLATAKIPQILLSLEPVAAANTLTKFFNKSQLSQLIEILQAG